MRHTVVRQHHELSQTLLPHLAKSLLQVEAATVQLKGSSKFCSNHIGVIVCWIFYYTVRHFFGFQPEEDYNLKESSDPDVAEFITAGICVCVCVCVCVCM